MRFANPEFLWLLLLLPLAAAYLIYLKIHDLPTLRFSSVKKISNDDKNVWRGTGLPITGGLRILALFLLVVAIARPQKGLHSEEMTTKTTDIMICLDASRSMLSIDFKPKDRFHMAKSVISDFIKGRPYDRLGMVLFAEYAVTQCPLTLDRNALVSILDTLEVGAIAPDQTAIGVGLGTCVNRLKNSQAKSKVIILLTDGANNAGSLDPLTAAKTAASFGIKLYTIGAASPDGGLMPIDDPRMGTRYVQIKNDLDEDLLLKIASTTGGKYFRATSSEALKSIFKEIDALEKTDINVKEYVDYQELYLWFLILAALSVLSELALTKTLYRTLP